MSEWTIDKIEELTTELERTKCALAAQVDDTLNAIQSLRKAEVRAEEAETELTWYGEQWEAAALTVLGALGFPAWQQLPDPVDVAAGIRMLSAERDKAEARAERAEKERAELRHKLDCVPPNMGNACNQIDVLAKQVAALRAALERIARNDIPDGDDPWGSARAALADPNLGADWVPHAELRRVAEAVQLRCAAYVVGCGFVDDIELRKIAAGMMATDHVDLDAIVRGGK
jgi:DNA repair exonuclease SbcCD ATPase subunit